MYSSLCLRNGKIRSPLNPKSVKSRSVKSRVDCTLKLFKNIWSSVRQVSKSVWFFKIKSFIIHVVLRQSSQRVLWGPSPRPCTPSTQLLSKKCRSGGKLLATLCPIWPARDLNLRPPVLEANALLLCQLALKIQFKYAALQFCSRKFFLKLSLLA